MNLAAHSELASTTFGARLRAWRQRRRLSQLDLAVEAEISTRHLSYVETGRAKPSREMVLHLTSTLQVPLRDRNALLVAAGYAPIYGERPLDDPTLAAAKQAVDLILKSHEPFPALAVDRHWNLLAANRLVPLLMMDVDESLLQAPVNVLRMTLHPMGLASKIINLAQWRAHLFERLAHQVASTADPTLRALLAELHKLPQPTPEAQQQHLLGEHMGVAVPLRLRSPLGTLSFISTTTVFGSPADVTLQELALETFFPLDESTKDALVAMAAGGASGAKI
jgi:transcriptional regulator with XRE-family HTH domain